VHVANERLGRHCASRQAACGFRDDSPIADRAHRGLRQGAGLGEPASVFRPDYTRDYVSAEDADIPGYNVFTRKDGTIRHFWSGEGGKETADPGQDSHDAPDMSGLWVILDTTPEGRGTDWYPKLQYDADAVTG
jgi:predicted dithiol-disulfide oxidoreductase (DUF899 family)